MPVKDTIDQRRLLTKDQVESMLGLAHSANLPTYYKQISQNTMRRIARTQIHAVQCMLY